MLALVALVAWVAFMTLFIGYVHVGALAAHPSPPPGTPPPTRARPLTAGCGSLWHARRPTRVDFHFDVMCPFAYQTAKWIREVRGEIGIEIDWKFFSLEEVNRVEGKKHPWERGGRTAGR